MGTVVDVTIRNFAELLQKNEILVMVFWAKGSPPCNMYLPVYEKLAKQDTGENIVYGKVDTKEESELTDGFQATSLPRTMIFREQLAVFAQSGLIPEKAFLELLKQIKTLDMDEVRRLMVDKKDEIEALISKQAEIKEQQKKAKEEREKAAKEKKKPDTSGGKWGA
jgi:thioredoxin-like negative regulator of GroEL